MQSERFGRELDPNKFNSGLDTSRVDLMLIALVSTVESGGEFRITFSVNGIIVSGVATSTNNFFDGIIEKIRNSATEESPTEALSIYERILNEAKAVLGKNTESAEGEQSLTPYGLIHLRDAQLRLPGSNSIESVGWWRCRLDEVDGWTFG
jgi:hypothetical protein